MTPSAALPSRADFLALFGETDRLLQLRTALPDLALVPEALQGHEAVNAPDLDGLALDIDALSTNAHFELKRLVGEQITVRLRQADGSHRALHGYVTTAAQLGGNGGLARYRLGLRSWTTFAAQRLNSAVFQHQDVRQIVDRVLAQYPQAHWRWEARRPLPSRELCTQYNETDAAFVARLLAESGLAWHLEHAQGDAAAEADRRGHARHCLVIHDADSHPDRRDLGSVRFAVPRPQGGPPPIGTLHQFQAERGVVSLAHTHAHWSPEALHAPCAQSDSALPLADTPRLEHFDPHAPRHAHHGAALQARAEAARQAAERDLKRFQGLGHARHLQAGARFRLIDHPHHGPNTTAWDNPSHAAAGHRRDDNAFTLTALQHRARNNLGADMARLLGAPELEAGHYECALRAAPAAAPLTPDLPRRPTARGTQLARVVGVDGEAITTERNGRVKIQFPWQRGQRPNAGGLPATGAIGQSDDAPDHAPGNERASAWVRVAQPQAGANWGAQFTPRLGAEVLVAFVDGDIDQPLVVGQLYNGRHRPPWSAGEGSGANHPGTLSGLRSQGLDGNGHNHWLLDDTPGQLRTRLMSSHTGAELSLGELIGHNPLSSTRGAWRGAGAELATQGWGTLRAPQGLLLSTTARMGSYGSAQGAQMDAQEATAQLRAARDLGERLSAASTPAGAAGLKTVGADQAWHTAVQDLDPAARGKFPGTVNGQSGLQDASASGSGRAPADPVPRPARPYVLLDTPSTLAHATQGDVMRLSGLSMSRITQGDQHDTAAHTAVHVAGQGLSLYSHQGQLQVKAAAGPVSIQAHTDAMEILADQSVQILSVNDRITLSAQDRIEIVAGDSKVTLQGGDVEFSTPGTFEVKSATHNFLGGGSGRARLGVLPQASSNSVLEGAMATLASTAPTLGVKPKVHPLRYYEQFRAVDEVTGTPIAGQRYRIEVADGRVIRGRTDQRGLTRRLMTDQGVGIKLFWEAKPETAIRRESSTDGPEC